MPFPAMGRAASIAWKILGRFKEAQGLFFFSLPYEDTACSMTPTAAKYHLFLATTKRSLGKNLPHPP
jgi:hypothetical protein